MNINMFQPFQYHTTAPPQSHISEKQADEHNGECERREENEEKKHTERI